MGDNLKDLKFDKLLDREHIGIGSDTWACISMLEEEYDTKPFFDAVKTFYISSIQKNFHSEIIFFKTWGFLCQTK